MKNALITGANKSIGFETARQLGLQGYHVWLGSRDAERGEAAAARLREEGINVRLATMDVTDAESIDAVAQRIAEQDGKLDLLINNAGILGMASVAPEVQSLADIMPVYDTNVFGAIRVTQRFLPLLRGSDAARIVMVSSGLGSLTWVSDTTHPYSQVRALGYTSSKSALNGVTVAFANALLTEGISVNAVDPGYTATDFNGHSGYRTVAQAVDGIVWLATQAAQHETGGFYFDRARAPW